MALSPTSHRFTVDDYHRMAEAGIFDPEDRVELIDGEVMEMSPIGPPHGSRVDRLNRRFVLGLGERAIVRVQGAVQIGEFSEPQPDLVVLRDRADFYADHNPMPPDVLLVVEVADSSLQFDLRRKVPLYLAGGVPEVWIIDLVNTVVHVYRAEETFTAVPGDSLSPVALPAIVLDVADILG